MCFRTSAEKKKSSGTDNKIHGSIKNIQNALKAPYTPRFYHVLFTNIIPTTITTRANPKYQIFLFLLLLIRYGLYRWYATLLPSVSFFYSYYPFVRNYEIDVSVVFGYWHRVNYLLTEYKTTFQGP